jgi:hypothetical protein
MLVLLQIEDWRTRRFIRTLLKYDTNHRIVEGACEAGQRVDLLICDRESAERVSELRPSKVLLLSARQRPSREIGAACRSLPVPFATAEFLNCVKELLAGTGADNTP